MKIRPRSSTLIPVLCVIAGLFLPYSHTQAQFRVIIDTLDASHFPEIRIVFRVLDGAQAVGGLTRSNFLVTENGKIQGPLDGGCEDSITVFESSIMMLLDRSGSIDMVFPTVRTAAKSFIDASSNDDEFSVYSFGGNPSAWFCDGRRVSRERPWTSDKVLLKQSIDAIEDPCGGTPMWDCVLTAKDDFINNGKKRVMILLTDGEDSYNEYTHTEVITRLIASSVRTFTIGLGSGIQEYILQTVAERTGGKYYEAPTAQELEDIYHAISQELMPSGNCELTYTANHDCLNGSTVQVVLEVSQGSRKAQATASYVLPTDPSTYSYVDIMMNENYIVDAGAEITVPLTLTRITDNRPATDFEFDIAFDSQLLELTTVATTPLSDGYTAAFVPTVAGAKVTLKGNTAIVDTGAILTLSFKAQDANISSKSALALTPMNIHQPCTESTADNGLITINGFCERTLFHTNGQLLKTSLLPNSPNPFNPETVIRYTIGKEGKVALSVFDAAGRQIQELFNGYKAPGEYSLIFDAKGLTNGVYYVRLESEGVTAMQRIVLLK